MFSQQWKGKKENDNQRPTKVSLNRTRFLTLNFNSSVSICVHLGFLSFTESLSLKQSSFVSWRIHIFWRISLSLMTLYFMFTRASLRYQTNVLTKIYNTTIYFYLILRTDWKNNVFFKPLLEINSPTDTTFVFIAICSLTLYAWVPFKV